MHMKVRSVCMNVGIGVLHPARPRLTVVRFDPADVNPFVNPFTSNNGDGAIGVNLLDNKGTDCAGSQFIWFVNEDKNFITDIIILVAAAKIFTAIILVDAGLTAGARQMDVGNQRDWQKHVALETKSAGRNIQSGVNGGACSELCRCEAVDKIVSMGDVCGRI